MNSLRIPSVNKVAMLTLVASAIGTMHSGGVTAVLIAPIFGVALVMLAVWGHDRKEISNGIFLCGLVTAMPFIASGLLSRPLSIGVPGYNVSWSYILPRALDLESQGIPFSGLSAEVLQYQVALAGAVWAGLLALAMYFRHACATGLLGGSAILLVLVGAAGMGDIAFQLIGFFYPAVICGAMLLVVDGRAIKAFVLAVAMLTIAQRMPRFAGAINLYALHQSEWEQYLFSAAEIERLAKEIGSQTVQIDVEQIQSAILLKTELGRRHVNLQWSQRGWDTAFGFERWPLPAWTVPPTAILRLVNGGGAFKHFELFNVRK